jgi:hypothetical protein
MINPLNKNGMKVTFYKFKSEYDGMRVQRDVIDGVEYLSKSEVMRIADLRHPVLTKNEYYTTLSTDINNLPKHSFELLSTSHLMVIEPFIKQPK